MRHSKFFCALMALSLVTVFVFSQTSSLSDLSALTGSLNKTSPVEGDTNIPNAQLAMSLSYYPVTAGDVYTLTYAAAGNAVKYVIPVDTSYKIRVANLGVINCEGLSYMQLKSQVESIVIKNYPLSGVQFVLTSPSSFIVTVSGEVKETVECSAWSLTRLSSVVLPYLTNYASTRNITVTSSSGTSKNYDLFLAKRNGDLSQDPYLRPGDTVTVNRYERKVKIEGAVERPGEYELCSGENLKELVEKYAGGLEPLADTSRIELVRTVTGNGNSGVKAYLSGEDIKKNKELVCYDSVYIFSYWNMKPVIFVEGAVSENVVLSTSNSNADKAQGAVLQSNGASLESVNRLIMPFNEGEDYSYFIRRNKNMFSANSDVEKAYVLREGKAIPMNLNPILYDSTYHADFPMKANDTLIIPFRQFFVSVAGAVKNPGRYPYIPDRTWDYYVGLAGGFVKSQNSFDAVSIVDINGNKLSKTDVITPETTITASTNSFLYFFNQYGPVITTLASIISTTLTILITAEKL